MTSDRGQGKIERSGWIGVPEMIKKQAWRQAEKQLHSDLSLV